MSNPAANAAKSVLVTGCSSGIGYYCAHALKRNGFRVFATARSPEDVRRLTDEGLEALRLDLDDSQSIRAAVAEVESRCGGSIYGLFNNGAFGQPGAVEDLRREVLRAQFEANLFGTHELTTLVIPGMRRSGIGRIVQNSSLLGFVTLRWRGAYNASKYALEGLSDTLRLELEGSGIAVSLIEPGPIASAFGDNALEKFLANVDIEESVHRSLYRRKVERFRAQVRTPFTLGPEAVYAKLHHALTARHPRIRYKVTFPSHLFGVVKRFSPDLLCDKLLRRVE